jgi:MFS family permease
MTKQIKIENIIRNTRKYWYVDGLSEIAGGLIIFAVGLTYWLVSTLENISIKAVLLMVALPAVIIIGSLIVRKYLPNIKERITYPRTGYLTFRKPPRNRSLKRALIVGMVAGLIGALVTMVSSRLPDNYLPLLSSVFLFIFSIYIAYQTAVSRFYVIGLLMVLLGAAISFMTFENVLPYTLFFSGVGIIWIISGVITLLRYLRNTSPQSEDV